jgi:hypothetical protein
VRTRSPRYLLPREHGTYGEILFPLCSALLVGQMNRAAMGLAAVAIGGFLAHEGFVVLLGTRGSRAQRTARMAAWRSLLSFGAIAAAGASIAWPGFTLPVLYGVALASSLSMAALLLAWFGREHSLAGELLVALALTAWCVPVALAAAVPIGTALRIWLVWCVLYAAATCAVHAVIASRVTAKRLRQVGWSIVGLSVVTMGGVWLVFG